MQTLLTNVKVTLSLNVSSCWMYDQSRHSCIRGWNLYFFKYFHNELLPYPSYKLNFLEWNSLRNQLHICWFIGTSLGCVVALRTLTTQLHREHSIPCRCCCQTVQRWMTDQVEVEGSVENIHIRMRTSLSVYLSVCLILKCPRWHEAGSHLIGPISTTLSPSIWFDPLSQPGWSIVNYTDSRILVLSVSCHD